MKPILALIAVIVPVIATAQTGPETEKRFPPLKLPAGFSATLFACDPLVEYPSVIALGPEQGSLFVAHDYMTGLGREIVRRDEIRLLADTDGDGYADTSTVYARGFNSIEGLEFFDGEVFAMHAPFLTRLRDTNGDGVADERTDLLSGLGLTPEENDVRLHCANGVTAGFDNWLYLAMGDHGVDVERPEGGRVVLNGGGILRCRRDGSDLHVFATGTRNIYDVALDANLNVFIRDNENDGGNFKIRVSHTFFGADHGYPYLFRERPDELLKPLADLGLGSSAGGVCYLETAFPAEFRGNLFFAEWGKSIVRYPLTPAGSSFGTTEEHEFASGAESDSYPFKPTDIVVDRDGSLLISDWADGQRPKRGRARIYRIHHENAEPPPQPPQQLLARLDSPSAHVRIAAQLEIARTGAAFEFEKLGQRARIHAVWLIAEDPRKLLQIADSDPAAEVRLQAVRALGDLGEIDGLAKLGARESDQRIVREVVIALGRARWNGLPNWIRDTLTEPDNALAHTAKQMLRLSANHGAILQLVDLESGHPARNIALQALADWREPEIAEGLISRLKSETYPARQRELADLLARIHRGPGPWVYWEYRPAPRTANPDDWEHTEAIGAALNETLGSADFDTREFVLRRMRREKIAFEFEALANWFNADFDATRAASILRALAGFRADKIRPLLANAIRDPSRPIEVRLAALREMMKDGLGVGGLADGLPDDAVLAEILKNGKPDAALLLAKLKSTDPHVRAAAIRGLGFRRDERVKGAVLESLTDQHPVIRAAAASAAGWMKLREASEQLLAYAGESSDIKVRSYSLQSLGQLKEPRAIPVALQALDDYRLRQTALSLLNDVGGPELGAELVGRASENWDDDNLQAVGNILRTWSEVEPDLVDELAKLHGRSGRILQWDCVRVENRDTARELAAAAAAPDTAKNTQSYGTSGDSISILGLPEGGAWVCFAEITASDSGNAQLLSSANGLFEIWLNGRKLINRDTVAEFRPDSDRADFPLKAGSNSIVAIIEAEDRPRLHVRFRRKSSVAEQEQLIKYVLGREGNLELGRELFFDVEVTQCALCHRIDGEGGRIGPDLSQASKRFSRIHLLESILEPSRAIAPSYQSHVVILKDGTVALGTKIEEDDESITIGDVAGRHHRVLRADIREHQEQPVSIMPPGLEKRMTPRQLTDLLTFLLEHE